MSILYNLKLILNIIYFFVSTVYRMFVFVCCFACYDSRVAWAWAWQSLSLLHVHYILLRFWCQRCDSAFKIKLRKKERSGSYQTANCRYREAQNLKIKSKSTTLQPYNSITSCFKMKRKILFMFDFFSNQSKNILKAFAEMSWYTQSRPICP